MERKKKDENEEEWIEVAIECPDCVKGRIVQWMPRKSGKPPWRYHMPCETCKGDYESIVYQPKYCQIPDCGSIAKHKCDGVFCFANGWVCSEHWVEENIGYSQKGYVCINCWEEVGSGGH
jgi:DNA-directed RNA polymerase subunit RPC12/RpoP